MCARFHRVVVRWRARARTPRHGRSGSGTLAICTVELSRSLPNAGIFPRSLALPNRTRRSGYDNRTAGGKVGIRSLVVPSRTHEYHKPYDAIAPVRRSTTAPRLTQKGRGSVSRSGGGDLPEEAPSRCDDSLRRASRLAEKLWCEVPNTYSCASDIASPSQGETVGWPMCASRNEPIRSSMSTR